MPTAARLVALICLALLGWTMATIVAPIVKDADDGNVWFGGFSLAGAIAGWMFLGKKVGNPAYKAAFNGINAVIYGFFIIVFMATLGAIWDAMGYHAYRTIEDLLVGLTSNALAYLSYIRHPDVILYGVVGGALSGIISEMAHRRWR